MESVEKTIKLNWGFPVVTLVTDKHEIMVYLTVINTAIKENQYKNGDLIFEEFVIGGN